MKSIKKPVSILHENTKEATLMLMCLKKNWVIFCSIAENPNITVTELFIKLRMSQSDVSQRLASLRSFELFDTEKTGKEVRYSISLKAIKVAKVINYHVK